MDKQLMEDLTDILTVERNLHTAHDMQLITQEDMLTYRGKLNDKTHTILNNLITE